MVDLFDEVEGQLRTDRVRTLAIRAAPWISGVLVLALVAALGFWGWQTWEHRKIDEASQAFDASAQLLNQGNRTEAFTRLTETARSAPAGYRALALMQQGGIRQTENRNAEAVALFDQAAQVAPDPLLKDLAALRSVYLLLDTAPLAELERRLTPMAAAGRPYRLQAQEAMAMARLLAGQTERARAEFQVITLNLTAPQDVQRRAQLAISLIASGQAGALRETVRRVATMPPPPPSITLPPGLTLPQGAAPGGAAPASPQSGTAQ